MKTPLQKPQPASGPVGIVDAVHLNSEWRGFGFFFLLVGFWGFFCWWFFFPRCSEVLCFQVRVT